MSKRLTQEELEFLLTAADWLEDTELVGVTKAKILSRVAALNIAPLKSKDNNEPLPV